MDLCTLNELYLSSWCVKNTFRVLTPAAAGWCFLDEKAKEKHWQIRQPKQLPQIGARKTAVTLYTQNVEMDNQLNM